MKTIKKLLVVALLFAFVSHVSAVKLWEDLNTGRVRVVTSDDEQDQQGIDISREFDSVSDMLAQTDLQNGNVYQVNGLQGGRFRFKLEADAAADGGVIFAVPSGGRVFRQGVTDKVLVTWYGALGDNIANDTAPIQAAIDHVASSGSLRVVRFPDPSNRYSISSAIRCPAGVTLQGPGFIHQKSAAENGIEIQGQSANIVDLVVQNDGSGACYEVTGRLNQGKWSNFRGIQRGTAPAFRCGANGAILDFEFENFRFEGDTTGHPVPLIEIKTSLSIQPMTWRFGRLHMFSGSAAPAIHVEHTDLKPSFFSSVEFSNIDFEFVFGGAIRLRGVTSFTLNRLSVFDTNTTLSADLIDLGPGGTRSCSNGSITEYYRSQGSFAPGFGDLKARSTHSVTCRSFGSDRGGARPLIDVDESNSDFIFIGSDQDRVDFAQPSSATRWIGDDRPGALVDGDTTPSVIAKQSSYQTDNSHPTTIQNFDDGSRGQSFVLILDANTTVAATNISTHSGAAIVGPGTVMMNYDGTKWTAVNETSTGVFDNGVATGPTQSIDFVTNGERQIVATEAVTELTITGSGPAPSVRTRQS